MAKKKLKLETEKEKQAVKRLIETRYHFGLNISEFQQDINDEILLAVGVSPRNVTPAVMQEVIEQRLERMAGLERWAKEYDAQQAKTIPVEIQRANSAKERYVAEKIYEGVELTEEEAAIARRIFTKGVPNVKVKVKIEKEKEEDHGEIAEPKEPKVRKLLKPGAGKDKYGCKVGSQANQINEVVLAATHNPITVKQVADVTGLGSSRCGGHLRFLMEQGHLESVDGGYARKDLKSTAKKVVVKKSSKKEAKKPVSKKANRQTIVKKKTKKKGK